MEECFIHGTEKCNTFNLCLPLCLESSKGTRISDESRKRKRLLANACKAKLWFVEDCSACRMGNYHCNIQVAWLCLSLCANAYDINAPLPFLFPHTFFPTIRILIIFVLLKSKFSLSR